MHGTLAETTLLFGPPLAHVALLLQSL